MRIEEQRGEIKHGGVVEELERDAGERFDDDIEMCSTNTEGLARDGADTSHE